MSAPSAESDAGPKGLYISLETLREWRESATQNGGVAGADGPHSRILSLIDALEGPCGSCHPCSHWAAETWRQAGGELPHKYQVDEWREQAKKCEALVEALRAAYPPLNCELRYDGTEDPQMAAYVDAWREVDQIIEQTRPFSPELGDQ